MLQTIGLNKPQLTYMQTFRRNKRLPHFPIAYKLESGGWRLLYRNALHFDINCGANERVSFALSMHQHDHVFCMKILIGA